MDIVERLLSWLNYEPNDYIEPAIADIKEAADEIERLRQLNAELVAVIEESIDPESIEPVGTQVWLDKVYDLLDRATGG